MATVLDSAHIEHCRHRRMFHWTAPLCTINFESTQPPELRADQNDSLRGGSSPRMFTCGDAENAFKVRLSIRTALGDKAYAWDTNEEYLFKAMVAFSMRKVPNRETTEISNVLLCNVTQRVSFWFVVTDPSKNHTLPAVEIQSAIRMNRNRINNAFFLNDQTLEFLKIPSTLAPPTDPSMPIWIIIFSVIFCIVIVAVMLLILSGIRQRRRETFRPLGKL
ncbi:collectrin isoform X3 [Enhydra lutris kenyoni]|uniref:Collectrin isoform X3 n=1 Tax=Enhydra lutris kenyoni TaxID=391180 RepID=A0A2Y9KY60_ENHLU|nr:collectrin isoform X3 [Enhydra lutris kenyoni]